MIPLEYQIYPFRMCLWYVCFFHPSSWAPPLNGFPRGDHFDTWTLSLPSMKELKTNVCLPNPAQFFQVSCSKGCSQQCHVAYSVGGTTGVWIGLMSKHTELFSFRTCMTRSCGVMYAPVIVWHTFASDGTLRVCFKHTEHIWTLNHCAVELATSDFCFIPLQSTVITNNPDWLPLEEGLPRECFPGTLNS